jgi:hypothetical protein
MSQDELIMNVFVAFAVDMQSRPLMSLRGGNDLDQCRSISAFDSAMDTISDTYLEQNCWGLGYLDAGSWRHYLPYLMEYTVRHLEQGSEVVDALLNNLRPPDREPPRLESLTDHQQAALRRFLELLGFSDKSAHAELACQVIEEW